MDPLCEDCITIHDRSTQAVDVHHIKKIIDAPELRLAMDNLMSLCKPCHQIRTARGE
jgi:5-methylcytosine-specific restriction protein A